MNMGAPRKPGNNHFPDGFYPANNRNACRMKHPITGEIRSLKTKDVNEGLDRYWQIIGHFQNKKEAVIVQKFTDNSPLLSVLAKEYRERLPSELSKRGASKGTLLDSQTIKTYTNYLLNLESSLKIPVHSFGDPEQGPKMIRQYLAPWLNKPKTYNYRLTCYSRLFEYCIDKGLIQRNPCKDISNRTTADRNVYIPDEHYILIARQLKNNFHEVYARACDWLYLMSGRAGNMLDIQEDHINENTVKYFATKNRRLGEMAIDGQIQYLISWFQYYKKEQGIISPHLIVHPLYVYKGEKKSKVRRAIAAKPITVEHLYRRFQKAKNKAGLSKYDYTPRDLRPKSLTDETQNQGKATNKGMHSEQMQRKYVKRVVAEHITNSLKLIPWNE